MKFDLVVRAGRNRHPVAVVALVGWALATAACSSFSSNNGGKAGSGGAGGRATGGTGGTGGVPGTGGAAGTGTGGSSAGGAAGTNTDGGSDDTAGGCVLGVDGGAGSGDCCPDDPNKTQPGVCGCGVADTDTDGDLTPDCIDMCVTDRNKIAPGICGCNGTDVDTDGDGTADCNDMCPHDRTRTAPGVCGCGVPDTSAPFCLAHRYSFNDAAASTTVLDSVGAANGTAVNVALPGNGTLTLAGGTSDQYVKLPSHIISTLGDSATFEAWVTWAGLAAGGGVWQRLFDFGNNENGATGGQGTGTAFVFFTPTRDSGVSLLSVNTAGLSEVNGLAGFPSGAATGGGPHHLACVVDAKGVDGNAPNAAVFIDGVFVARTPLLSVLSALDDVNNWLGRSQFAPDPEFAGTYYEFRIYSTALTAAQISASFAAGPDTLP
jgi:hypothetical protein